MTIHPRGFDFLKDVDVRLSVELGRTNMTLRQVLALGEDSLVMLDRLTDELLDVMVNGTPIAIPDSQIYEEDLRLGKLVEPLGFDSLWSVEHHFTPYTMVPDVLKLLSYFAGCTERIEMGTMVIVFPIHQHYMSEWWTRPFEFDPERFSDARAEHKRHSHSFVPFGGGAHMCIGLKFAEIQVHAIVHQLVQHHLYDAACTLLHRQ